MCYLHVFMKKPAAACLNSCIPLSSESFKCCKERKLTIDSETVNYRVETYATDNAIAEMDAEILYFMQTSTMTPTDYAEALWNKALSCNLVYD